MMYDDDNILSISGIQHFVFCRRQWALIHIEQQWAENLLTVSGEIMHEKAHDDTFTETRNGIITSRGMQVSSYELGIYGVCDIVEFVPSDDGAILFGKEGKYSVVPVEYKHGEPPSARKVWIEIQTKNAKTFMTSCHLPRGRCGLKYLGRSCRLCGLCSHLLRGRCGLKLSRNVRQKTPDQSHLP